MQSILGEFLAWIAGSAQAIFSALPEAVTQLFSQSATAFSQLKAIASIEVPRFVGMISPAELMVAVGIVCILIGIQKRLYYRGVLLYLAGLGVIMLGLGNIVNPVALPLFLRF